MSKIKEGYKESAVGVIPENWEVDTFKNIITSTQLGINEKSSEKNKGIPLIKMGNLTIGGFDLTKLERLEDNNIDGYSDFILRSGDFLFNTRNTPELVGKSAAWKYHDKLAVFNSNIMRISVRDSVDTFWLSYYFASRKGWKSLKQISTGTTSVGAIYTKDLVKVELPIPPRPEQQRIAQILSTTDDHIEKLDKIIENYKLLKKGMMKRLLSEGIGHPEFKETEIGRMPKEWEAVSLSSLGDTFNGLSGVTKDDFGTGVPFIPYMNIFSNTKIDISRMDYINLAGNKQQNRVKYGDIFFTTSSETPEEAGMSSVLLDKVDEMYLNSFCFGYRLFDFKSLRPEFARFLLRADYVRKEIVKLAQGSTRFNLSKSNVMKIKIALPKVEEQLLIAEQLSDLEKRVTLLYEERKDLLELKKALMGQLLTGRIRTTVIQVVEE
jgi:type I restriction enzyme S subunit